MLSIQAKYLNEYANSIIEGKKMGFHSFQEAFNLASGYTCCLFDKGQITAEERQEFLNELSKKLMEV